ncbi:MAG: hypothetical protein EBZ91_07805 [Gammaproteobacteria bacterium]|nr:hypothetical protein [Gammaproteobacteria bacterium]
MITVPDNIIAVIPYDDYYRGKHGEVYFPLRGDNKREWFSRHAYFCLPLVIGNQYGFAVKSLFNATFLWNGGPEPGDTTVTIHNTEDIERHGSLQTIVSNFGIGIVTVQTAFALRTPPNVNLMTIQPPNYFIDGLVENFEMVEGYELFTPEQIRDEQQASQDFGRERVERDVLRPDGVGRRYHNGEDVYGNPFPHSHQKSLTARPKKNTR